MTWLFDLFDRAFAWVPRLTIVRLTHCGVKFRRGKEAIRCRPGLHWHWPLVTDLVIAPAARQTLDLGLQSLLLADNQPLTVSGVLVYEIQDPVLALARNWDTDDTAGDLARAAIVDVLSGRTLEESRAGLADGTLLTALTDRVRRSLLLCGLFVHRVGFVTFIPAPALRILMNPHVTEQTS